MGMSGIGGRHPYMDASDALLVELWNKGFKLAYIAGVLGFTHESSVSHAARRLGLAPREPNRTTVRAQEVNRLRIAERRKQQLAGEHDPEMPEPLEREEQPTCWVCAGRSATWDGHDACRGRKRKAA